MEKRRLLVFLFCSFIFLSFVNAQSNFSLDETGSVDNLKEGLGEGSQKIEEKISREVNIPEVLQRPAKIIFGIEASSPLNILVISLMLWLIFFAFFANIIEFFSPLSKSVSVAVAFALTAILSFMGMIRGFATFLFNIGEKINFLDDFGIFGTIIAFLVVFLFLFLLSRTFRRMAYYKRGEKMFAKAAKKRALDSYTEIVSGI